ncbi:MAG TPA: BTAD domain-containing putative transcriptional regulator [Glycomyces sp.]
MEFRILGALEVRHDGREVPISGAQQRKALAVLLLESGRTVSLQRLTEALWNDEPPATARRQVRNIVAAVRRTLAVADPIERSGDGYRLCTDATDWNDFRTKVAKAKASGDSAETHRLLGQALQHWRGPVLAGLDSEFIAAAALGMEEERLAAFEDFFEAGLALGLHRELTGAAQSCVAEHPYRQRLTGHLMLALYRSGNGAAALQAYTDLGSRLADELGIEPDRRLRDLYVAILREDPELDLEPAVADQSRAGDPPLKARPAGSDGAPVESLAEPLTAPPPPQAVPEADPGRASRLSSRHFSRVIALTLVVFAVVLATAADAVILPLPNGDIDRAVQSVARDVPGDPLWAYPALESGSAVMKTDAGLLILDGTELRLEVDGEAAWSKRMDAQSIPSVAVFADRIVLSYSARDDQPWSTGEMIGINLATGRERWTARDLWPVARTEDSLIAVTCEGPMTDGAAGACAMESVEPGLGMTQWRIELEERAVSLLVEAPYESPWGRRLRNDYLVVRSYPVDEASTGERLSVYDIEAGRLLSEFDIQGVETAQVDDDLLMVQEGSAVVADGRCESHFAVYEIRTGDLSWERYMETPTVGPDECEPPPTPGDAGQLVPATLSRTASVVWARSGELQWSVPEPSIAQMLVDEALVTTDPSTGRIAVWDVWSHEQRWTADPAESIWPRGATLWVLDREAVGPDCGGVVGYSLETGQSVCLPGSLVYLSEDEVVTVDNGTWQAWPADPWG